jgi:hypothetical protein
VAQALGAVALEKRMALEDPLLAVYYEALADLDAAEIERACQQWILAHKWFPQVCELRELIRPPTEDAEAELAWREVVAYMQAGWWHPDIGHKHFFGEEDKTPVLPPRTHYAIRQVGCFHRLWEHQDGDDALEWMHKEFVAAWKRVPEQERLAGSLEPKALLDKLQKRPVSLPSAPSPVRPQPANVRTLPAPKPAKPPASALNATDAQLLEEARRRVAARKAGA